MAYQSKQRTIEWNGQKIKVLSRVATDKGKTIGFRVSINNEPTVLCETQSREEAEQMRLDAFKKAHQPKKAKAKKVKVQAPKKAEKNPQAEAQETPITNKDKFIVLADKRNSSWLTEEELKDKLFELLQKRMGDMSEFSMEQMIILRGLNGDKYQITITWAG